jgi:hypothetical protein
MNWEGNTNHLTAIFHSLFCLFDYYFIFQAELGCRIADSEVEWTWMDDVETLEQCYPRGIDENYEKSVGIVFRFKLNRTVPKSSADDSESQRYND